MNTAACCPLPALPTARPWWQSLLLDLESELSDWKARRVERLTARALQGLSQHTLRDIGMAERVLGRTTSTSLVDCERGRWS
jgi:hypothetical protein